MWTISVPEIFRMRTPGGREFTEFADHLIRATAFLHSIPDAAIRTNVRTNLGDKGVDTEVLQPIGGDRTGWFETPTVWQYKATEHRGMGPADLRAEIRKPYSRQRVEEGAAYRLCICDDLAVATRQEWEEELGNVARDINGTAPAPRVITASDLAGWTNRFPSLVVRFFRPELGLRCLHLDAWKDNVVSATPNYVTVDDWNNVTQSVREHCNYQVSPVSVVLPISGEAGVGKTRLTYEVLRSLPGAEGLVLYTLDDRLVLEIAMMLANESTSYAILVADDCGLQSRVQLQEALRGHSRRARVITIDNTGTRPPTGAPEPWLEELPARIVEEILNRNFPHIPFERRRAYAEAAAGFVRYAVDLCNNDELIAPAGRIMPALTNTRDYLRARLHEDERTVLEALALVTKVGMSGDVETELQSLCELIHSDIHRFREIAERLRSGPGFVGRGGRFYYITPELIARICFEAAWARWADPDPASFLERFPGVLLAAFLERAGRSENEEVRRIVGEFFRKWSRQLGPRQLRNLKDVNRLAALIEIEPQVFLAILRDLVEAARVSELKAVTGHNIGGQWGPRRTLVWLAERMASFLEYFENVERILLRLAIAESEPNIGNNASAIWRQLFRMVLSGTAVPFMDRLRILEERIYSEDNRISVLAVQALNQLFETYGTRMVGPAVVAGKIPPPEWRPRSAKEERECLDATVSLLTRISKGESPRLRSRSREIALHHTRRLLVAGYLEALEEIIGSKGVGDRHRSEFIKAAEEFLSYDSRHVRQEYARDVRTWAESLRPKSFHAKLVHLVGSRGWTDSTRIEAWRIDSRAMAKECLENRERFKRELKWLSSRAASNATLFGSELGRADVQGSLFDLIKQSVLDYKSTSLAKGYINGFVLTSPQHAAKVNDLIDEIQKTDVGAAYELFMAGGDVTDAFGRTIKLVDEGKLPVTSLGGFALGIGSRHLTIDELEEALARLVSETNSEDPLSQKVAIRVTGFYDEEEPSFSGLLASRGRLRELVSELLEKTTVNGGGDPYRWKQILGALAEAYVPRAISIAARGLAARDLLQRDAAEEVLSRLAKVDAGLVMDKIGELVLDDQYGMYFYALKYSVIQSLPIDIVTMWITKHGVEAARRLARHLPVPYLDGEGHPMVPPLTEFVLEKYEEDDRTFREFCAGVHSFQFYTGDISAQRLKEAEVARKFLNHRLRRIREWAQHEIDTSLYEARSWQQEEEERRLG